MLLNFRAQKGTVVSTMACSAIILTDSPKFEVTTSKVTRETNDQQCQLDVYQVLGLLGRVALEPLLLRAQGVVLVDLGRRMFRHFKLESLKNTFNY